MPITHSARRTKTGVNGLPKELHHHDNNGIPDDSWAEGTDGVWTAAEKLLSEHYYVWAPDSGRQGMAFPPQAFSTFP